jgi:hypothetical protein
MRRDLVWWGTSITIFLAICVGTIAWREFQDAKRMAVWSDLMLIQVTLERQPPDVPTDDRWKVFDRSKCNEILMSCGFDGFKDSYRNDVRIAARRQDGGKVEFVVWSPGPDGVFGNGDDIFAPDERAHEIAASSATLDAGGHR